MSSRFSLQFWLTEWKFRRVADARKPLDPKRLMLETLESRLPPGDLFGLAMPSFMGLFNFHAPLPAPPKSVASSSTAAGHSSATQGAALIGSSALLTTSAVPPASSSRTGSTSSSTTSTGTTGFSASDPFGGNSFATTQAIASASSQPVPPVSPPGGGGGGSGSLISSNPQTNPVMLTRVVDPRGKDVTNQFTNSATPTVQGIARPGDSIKVSVDGRAAGTVTADANGNFGYRTARLADGPHSFTAALANGTGGASPSIGTTVDTVAPRITLVANDFVGSHDQAWVKPTVTSTDQYGYNPTIHIDVDLNHDGTFAGTGELDAATGFGASFDMPIQPEGTYQVRARVFDYAGNVGTSNVVTMQFDPNAGILGSQALRELAGLGTGNPGGPGDLPGGPGNLPGGPGNLPGGPGGKSPPPGAPTNSPLRFDPDATGLVMINARATLPRYFAGFQNDLTTMGMVVLATAPSANMVTGWFPIAKLGQLEQVAHYSAAVPVYQPITYAGSVQTEGDAVILGPSFRASQGVDGTGVKVGVLSDSVSKFAGGLADSIKTGDLPNNVQVLKDFTKGTDEGRGMLEIVHDVAPGSGLAFYTAFVSETDFAAGIIALAAAGCKVISDDVGYATAPIFSDGRMAHAVDQVFAGGAVYTSSAGNDAAKGYRNTWQPRNTTIDSVTGNFQDFGGGNSLQKFTLAKNGKAQISFQWDSAYLEGGDPAANYQVTTDMVAYVVDTTTNKIVATQDDNNANTDQALEFLSYTNSTNNTAFAFAFRAKSGPAPTNIAWIEFGSTPLNAVQENGPTSFGQTVAKGAISTGAADVASPLVPESFSSKGGNLQIFFDSAGNRLATPEVRQKPNVTGPDGGHTSFFGSPDGRGGFQFFGTSAAAPHVAAAAALLMQQAPTATNMDIVQHLSDTALDLLTPGFDDLTGAGLVQLTPLTITPLGSDPFDPNQTSDVAANLGVIGTSRLSFSNLTIADQLGLPNYDWFTYKAAVNGAINVTMDNRTLELHLFTYDGTYLTEVANGTAVSAGQAVYVEVKGHNTAPGVITQGTYKLTVGLS